MTTFSDVAQLRRRSPPRRRPSIVVLSAGQRRTLRKRLEGAVKRARARGGEALAGLTVSLPASVDPSAVAFGSRVGGERCACLEEPDADGQALAALGCVRTLEGAGAGRFAQVDAAWRALTADAQADPPDGPPGAGLVAVGGFSFAPGGGRAPHWTAFAQGGMVVPEVALARRGDDVRLTLAALALPDDLSDDLEARVERRLRSLRLDAELPLLDPDPVTATRIASTAPPEHYEAAIARGVERIQRGELEKIVLAREVQAHAPRPHDPAAVLGVLRDAFRSCYVYAVAHGPDTFIGASPELLIRRDGMRAQTVALAGSMRRSADPGVDAHLGEQLLRSDKDRSEHEIVVRRVERALRPRAVWVAHPPEPVVVSIANIQHLATPVRAQLAHPTSAVRLAGALHPTPAVGGEPFDVAGPLIPALEGLDRGWYAAPVGWTDANDDGQFCVALRCALLRGPLARLYAGVGVVADSDPAAELAETEVKLGALLPVLSA